MGRVLARPGRGGGCQGDRKWHIASLTRIVVGTNISHFRNCEKVKGGGKERRCPSHLGSRTPTHHLPIHLFKPDPNPFHIEEGGSSANQRLDPNAHISVLIIPCPIVQYVHNYLTRRSPLNNPVSTDDKKVVV